MDKMCKKDFLIKKLHDINKKKYETSVIKKWNVKTLMEKLAEHGNLEYMICMYPVSKLREICKIYKIPTTTTEEKNKKKKKLSKDKIKNILINKIVNKKIDIFSLG